MKIINLLIVGAAILGWAGEAPPQLFPVSEAVGQTGIPNQVPMDVRPENARTRIVQRNLFHPTRGVLPASATGTEGTRTGLPMLLGTLLYPKHPSAMLRWGNQDARIVEEGEEAEGYRIKKITSNRVQLLYLQDSRSSWVVLDPVSSTENGSATELEALLALTGKKPVPAPGSHK